jgi:hypothetical protein
MSRAFDDDAQEIPAAVVPKNYLINPKLLVVLVVSVMFCAFCIWAQRKHDQREASKHSRIQVRSALLCSHRSYPDRVFLSFFVCRPLYHPELQGLHPALPNAIGVFAADACRQQSVCERR